MNPNGVPPKKKIVRHHRAIQRDRSKRVDAAPFDERIEQQLDDLVQPAVYTQMAAYRAMGLRERVLTLPVMVAFVLSLIWRQLGSVQEAVRVLNREGLLWAPALSVSQSAVSQRLTSLPASLFAGVLAELLPRLSERWHTRHRPLPPVLAWAQQHFTAVLALDGSTLDSLLRKTGLLQGAAKPVLGGRMAGLLDVLSRLPRHVWYEEHGQAHDQRFWEPARPHLPTGALLLFDLGFVKYRHFDALSEAGVYFLTRLKDNAQVTVQAVLSAGATWRDERILLGGPTRRRAHPYRLVQVLYRGKWYRYLTNVLAPEALPVPYVVPLYAARWRIEDAFNLVKRLLGLAYLWSGALNAVQVQLWMTWLLYAVLVDLTDAVADTLQQPFQALSLEMTYRGLYHFTQARQRGETDDPIRYLADHAKSLGILKRKRPSTKDRLLPLTVPQDP